MGGSGVSGGWTGRGGDCFSPPCTECAPALSPEDRDVPPNDPSGTPVFSGAVVPEGGNKKWACGGQGSAERARISHPSQHGTPAELWAPVASLPRVLGPCVTLG